MISIKCHYSSSLPLFLHLVGLVQSLVLSAASPLCSFALAFSCMAPFHFIFNVSYKKCLFLILILILIETSNFVNEKIHNVFTPLLQCLCLTHQ